MSETTDVESNHICATEYAFDKFQAKTLNEEDEYIKFSDVMSSTPPREDLPKILHELQSDPKSSQDPEQNKNLSVLIQEKCREYNSSVTLNNKKNNSKRRGKKNKNRVNQKVNSNKSINRKNTKISTKITSENDNKTLEIDLNYDMIIEEDKPELLSDIAENKISTLELKESHNNKLVSKRGRAVKSKLVDEENKKIDQKEKKKSLDDIPVSSKVIKHNKTDMPLENNFSNINTSGILGEIDSNNHLKTSDNDFDEDLPLVVLSKNNKVEDPNVSGLILSSDMKETLLNNISNNHIDDSVCSAEKTTKKRGRPKKYNKDTKTAIKVNLDLKECEQNPLTNKEDINLNQLKIGKEKSNSTEILDSTELNEPKITQDLDENLPNESVCKRSLKKLTMSDFEYNIDSIIKNDGESEIENIDLLMKESSRPVRRRVKKNFDYDEGSDEDPFANIELSDDESPIRKKGGRYANRSDDEYIPGKKRPQSDLSDSDIDEEDLEEFSKQKKKKCKKLDLVLSNRSPKKRSKRANIGKTEQSTLDNDIDLEVGLYTSKDDKGDDQSSPDKLKDGNKKGTWGESNEFQNFLAKIAQGTDIKIKKAKPIDNEKTLLQIPVLDPTEKKKVEMFTQTNIATKPVAVQTSTLYDIPMKNQVALTAEQSEKACEFLAGIVKTTSELGQLMTQKSEDFIDKKINTKHVTDTFKMDYCVKKSFLLFKLAKHNLVQMEEDLSRHYEEFLKTNDLLKHREDQKIIASTSQSLSDSDCEIVEEPVLKNEKRKSEINLKTVFLNKELSIKIAKKPTENPNSKEKLNIKGRHTVWINDSVMVKKIKPNQSFLAQDSRNKKPPDTFVTFQMVSDFFKKYEHQKAIQICAPYIRIEGFYHRNYMCCYFFKDSSKFFESSEISSNEQGLIADGDMTVSELVLNKTSPQSLCSICIQVLQTFMNNENPLIAISNQPKNPKKIIYIDKFENSKVPIQNENVKFSTVCSLKILTYNTINKLIYDANDCEYEIKKDIFVPKNPLNMNKIKYDDLFDVMKEKKISCNTVKSLFSLSVESLKYLFKFGKENNKVQLYFNPRPLKNIVLNTIKNVIYDIDIEKSRPEKKYVSKIKVETLLRKCINFFASFLKDEYSNGIIDQEKFLQYNLSNSCDTLRYLSLNKVMALLNEQNSYENTHVEREESLKFTINNINTISEDAFLDGTYESDNNDEYNFSEEDGTCCHNEYMEDDNIWVSQIKMQELRSCVDRRVAKESGIMQNLQIQDSLFNIKIEPSEEETESFVDLSSIKHEPIDDEEINIMPLDIITKQENEICTSSNKESYQRKNTNSYDVDTFEAFVSSNKITLSLCENEEIYSQSTFRVRRQYEPDLDDDIESDTDNMNLLVPHSVETAKNSLMESSSNEDEITKKEKRKRKLKPKKPKKISSQLTNENETAKNDVAMLTRKMRDKIKREKKKYNSSDSEIDNLALNLKKNKLKTSQSNQEEFPEKEIQCNDVDSTEKIYENEADKSEHKNDTITDAATSTNIENNEIEQSIIFNADNSKKINDENRILPPLMKATEPIELIECQPTISLYQNYTDISNNKTDTSLFTDRHGWQCYSIDGKDSKIYQYSFVSLDKLPESFVETYFRYQNIAHKGQEDAEVDKLTNLNSLHHPLFNQTKEKGCSEELEVKQNFNKSIKKKSSQRYEQNVVKIEACDELVASEEEKDYEDNITTLSGKSSENCLAKDSLMGDDSDLEKLQDGMESYSESKDNDQIPQKNSSGHLIKCNKKFKVKSEELMLTVDKVMNKELRFLNAPVEIKKELDDKKDIASRLTRNSHRIAKIQMKKETNEEDDSSSEEEKQWFTTKEKLLKRLQKKQEIPNIDDAKRAKIVSEFIEKRGEGPELRQRGRRKRRSNKRLLERQKQMKILSFELFGQDSSHAGKKYSQAVSKGRKNIRKVIDKKSLGRSTVLANMEEFERKQRLNQRQVQLREVLGCEEGVNVVVINDELCLEYDFEGMRPIVSVHPFFTKVMKSHQYEGVKFMWDACFESVSAAAAGGGGGCILAHCMGLGKTLQVLALLHTVLTHPKLEMRRVLVCCPLSTVLNWVDEINKWIGPVTKKIKVFELSKLKKTYERAYQLEDWYNGGGIFIIGYELFRTLTTLDPMLDNVRPTIVNKIRMTLLDPGPDMIICDEGHLLKNDCSVLAVAMSRVATKRRIVLTGTPMQNNLREYYCMVNFVKPNLLGTYSEYSNRFENPIMNGQHRDSIEEDIKLMKARTHILHRVLEGCLQRQEASVLYPYLPKKHEYTLFISLTQCQRELYNYYLLNYTKDNKQSVLKDFHVLQKIWSHPQVLHNFMTSARDDEQDIKLKVKLEDELAREELGAPEHARGAAARWLPHVPDDALHSLRASNKFLIVFRLLDECVALGDKVLIFSTSLYTMDALEYFLREREWALGREYFRLDGSVPPEVRQKWCREFNAPNNLTTKLFLISTRAGCLGLNMTAANRVIILDTSWNPAHDIQSIFRVYRFGQKKDCYIYRIVAMGTMEQKIYERSVTKQAVACRVVDEQQIDRHYNMSDLSELYKLDEEGSGVSAGLATGVRDAALLRVASADEAGAALHAVHEHDSLLRGSGESGLDELERDAAWTQFQQEHTATHTKIRNIEIKRLAKTEKSDEKIIPEKETSTQKLNVLPSTSRSSDVALDPETEDSIIKKIMNILIQHNYQSTKSHQEISDLVANVRKLILNPKKHDCGEADPLIASIAKVLKENENISLFESNKTNNVNRSNDPETNLIETIIGTPVDEVARSVSKNEEPDAEHEYTERKCRKLRRMSDEEYVPDSRRKKKRLVNSGKLKANKSHENNLSTDSHEIDDIEVHNSEQIESENMKATESQLSSNNNNINTPLSKIPSNKKSIEEDSSKSLEVASEEHGKSTNSDILGESIVLSDDDDEPLTSVKSAAKESKPLDNCKKSKIDDKNDDGDDPVPLHKSLLTNKNFIKIVAHTYLTGNPMLDEDAAILAAQYSTLKALKEINFTGKDITSGPIYDIANQVLGKSLLKRLQNIRENTTTDISESVKLTNIESQSQVLAKSLKEDTQNTMTPPVTITLNNNDKKHNTEKKLENKMQEQQTNNVKHIPTNSVEVEKEVSHTPESPIHIVSMSQNVVPVGMFKGPASFHTSNPPSSQEECILPDDDDFLISPLNSKQSTITPAIIKSNIRKNVKKMIIRSVVSSDRPIASIAENSDIPKKPNILVAAKQTTKLINATKLAKSNTYTMPSTKSKEQKIESNKLSISDEVTKPVTSAKEPETICLDSDDEDESSNITNIRKPIQKEALQSTSKLSTALKCNKKVVSLPSILASKNIVSTKDNMISRPNTQQETSKKLSSVASKLQCKPGDVIRITTDGHVEVLKRTDKAKVFAPSTLTKNYSTVQNSSTPKITTSDNGIETASTSSSLTEKKIQIISGSKKYFIRKKVHNINTTQPNPDHLTVLQDVIHIEADLYEETINTSAKSENNTSKTSVAVQIDPKDKLFERDINKEGEKMQTYDLTTAKDTICISKVKLGGLNTSKNKQEKADKVIDLTENLDKKTDLGKKVSNKKTESIKIAGTSKEIIINKTGLAINNSKTISIQELKNISSSSKVTQKKSLTIPLKKNPSSDSVKRSSPWQEPSPNKKTKPNTTKPLRLQDFNIDDIVDIVELE